MHMHEHGVLAVVQVWCRGNPLFCWSVNEVPSMVVELAAILCGGVCTI